MKNPIWLAKWLTRNGEFFKEWSGKFHSWVHCLRHLHQEGRVQNLTPKMGTWPMTDEVMCTTCQKHFYVRVKPHQYDIPRGALMVWDQYESA
jgi:hypothetical protein